MILWKHLDPRSRKRFLRNLFIGCLTLEMIYTLIVFHSQAIVRFECRNERMEWNHFFLDTHPDQQKYFAIFNGRAYRMTNWQSSLLAHCDEDPEGMFYSIQVSPAPSEFEERDRTTKVLIRNGQKFQVRLSPEDENSDILYKMAERIFRYDSSSDSSISIQENSCLLFRCQKDYIIDSYPELYSYHNGILRRLPGSVGNYEFEKIYIR